MERSFTCLLTVTGIRYYGDIRDPRNADVRVVAEDKGIEFTFQQPLDEIPEIGTEIDVNVTITSRKFGQEYDK